MRSSRRLRRIIRRCCRRNRNHYEELHYAQSAQPSTQQSSGSRSCSPSPSLNDLWTPHRTHQPIAVDELFFTTSVVLSERDGEGSPKVPELHRYAELLHEAQKYPETSKNICKLPSCLIAGFDSYHPISGSLAGPRSVHDASGIYDYGKQAGKERQDNQTGSKPGHGPRNSRFQKYPTPAILISPAGPESQNHLHESYQPHTHSLSAIRDFAVPLQSRKDSAATLQIPRAMAHRLTETQSIDVLQRTARPEEHAPTSSAISNLPQQFSFESLRDAAKKRLPQTQRRRDKAIAGATKFARLPGRQDFRRRRHIEIKTTKKRHSLPPMVLPPLPPVEPLWFPWLDAEGFLTE